MSILKTWLKGVSQIKDDKRMMYASHLHCSHWSKICAFNQSHRVEGGLDDLMKIENKKEKQNKTGNTWGRFHNTRDDCSILSYFDNENEIAVLVFSDLANL